jgi:hypothetical protein
MALRGSHTVFLQEPGCYRCRSHVCRQARLRLCPVAVALQDHARVVMERITKWRATQLTPWKQRQQSNDIGAPTQSSPSGPARATSSARKPGAGADKAAAGSAAAGAAAAPPVMEGQQVVCRIYAGYSSMKTGSSVLGLHRDGYLQLLRDSGMLGASSRQVLAVQT